MRLRKRWYVGILQGSRTPFATASDVEHDPLWRATYAAVVGPFRTRRAAEFMASAGGNNPHCQTVRDAERIAARQARGKAAR